MRTDSTALFTAWTIVGLAVTGAAAETISWNGYTAGLDSNSTGADWLATAGSAGYDVNLEDFETSPANTFGPQSFDFGTGSTLATVTGDAEANVTVRDAPTWAHQQAYSGDNYLYFGNTDDGGLQTSSFTVDFTTNDVVGFSFHFGDLEVSDLQIVLDDGTTFDIAGAGEFTATDESESGWFGFLQDPENAEAISSITFAFDAANDGVSFDDFRIARAAGISTPTPTAGLLALAGGLGIAGTRSRRKES